MAEVRKNWRQISVRALLFWTFTAAVFFAGYRVGYQEGQTKSFDNLIELIQTTVAPDSWDEVGGSGTAGGEGICNGFTIPCEPTDDDNPFSSGKGIPPADVDDPDDPDDPFQ
jgi:hypothetical protein